MPSAVQVRQHIFKGPVYVRRVLRRRARRRRGRRRAVMRRRRRRRRGLGRALGRRRRGRLRRPCCRSCCRSESARDGAPPRADVCIYYFLAVSGGRSSTILDSIVTDVVPSYGLRGTSPAVNLTFVGVI